MEENKVRMSINKDIFKMIPENLVSQYESLGWKVEKETKSNLKVEEDK